MWKIGGAVSWSRSDGVGDLERGREREHVLKSVREIIFVLPFIIEKLHLQGSATAFFEMV